MTLATTISLASLRGPAPLAKAIAALDILSDGRVIAGVGPGSSKADYEVIGTPFDERWPRFEESVRILRTLLRDEPAPPETRFFPVPEPRLAPPPRRAGGVPLWIGSWGSEAGLRRVARLADGWLASSYNTTPEIFAAARALLAGELERRGRGGDRFPNALGTMWTWVTEDRAEAERMLTDVLVPVLKRDPEALRAGLCIGSAEHCAELLARYAAAGCERVLFWPLGDESAQIERLATGVRPLIEA
jgi:alkanesulfonate monooxygenase SsuD/methylene tetrahydromethanopterin reductase-like flavin-dependent oxidoreductase (luciferase family)